MPEWNRRTFLKTAGAGTAFTFVPRYVLGGKGFVPPSDTVNIAIIGSGGQGIENMKALLQEPDARIAAIADPNEESDYSAYYYKGTAGRIPALKLVQEASSKNNQEKSRGCSEYIDFRVMLEKEKAIDAVLVATPDHVHAVAVIAALQLGKHVYCEKPLCHSIYEVRKVVETARNAKVATQMGNQGHSGEGIRLTCEWIWDGAIGPIREVHAWADASRWGKVTERPTETPPVPSGLNWDLWLGPAAYRPYHPTYAPVAWRDWWDFGSGVIGDFACHHLDPAFWALKLGYPTSVEAVMCDRREELVPMGSLIYFEFPARGEMPAVKLKWYEGGLMPPTPEELEPGRTLGRDGHGILFVGDKGKMVCGGWGGTPRLIPETAMKAYKLPPKSLPRAKEHHREWLDACKGGPASSANFDAIGKMVEVVLMGVIAMRTGEKLFWDTGSQRFASNAKANNLLQPRFREGWSL